MWLAVADLYMPKWTEQIHAEWIDNALKIRPDLSREKLERTRNLMNQHAESSLVTDFEHLIPTLSLPDVNDRHVLAAAIECDASVIVTFNLRDFPEKALDEYDISAQHPDSFLSELYFKSPGPFQNAVQTMVAQLKNPPSSVEQYISVLRTQGLPETAGLLSRQ
jgi:predicted nucleic acid-binding protein